MIGCCHGECEHVSPATSIIIRCATVINSITLRFCLSFEPGSKHYKQWFPENLIFFNTDQTLSILLSQRHLTHFRGVYNTIESPTGSFSFQSGPPILTERGELVSLEVLAGLISMIRFRRRFFLLSWSATNVFSIILPRIYYVC